jgi:8-oxo-dGTP pyrophosphatase MutT (NUDIX family)
VPSSPYVQSLRSRVGHSLLLLPGVTAVIQREGRFLVARQRDTDVWSLIGGGIEPHEEPADAVRREVEEELRVTPAVGKILGAYGGLELSNTYPNGDAVSYVTIAYECAVSQDTFNLEEEELIEVAWLEERTIHTLPRHRWIDRVIRDAAT